MKYIHPPAVVSFSAPAILGENGFCHLGMVIMINHDWMSLITIKLINLKQASDSSDEKFCPSLCIIYLEMITITWSLIRYIIKRCYTGFISDFHCVFTLTLCLINVPFNQQSLVLNISVSTQYLFTAFCIHLPFTPARSSLFDPTYLTLKVMTERCRSSLSLQCCSFSEPKAFSAQRSRNV